MPIKSTAPTHSIMATSHQPTMDYLNPAYSLTHHVPPIRAFTLPKPLPPIHTSHEYTVRDRIQFVSSLLSHPHYTPPLQTRFLLQEYKTLCNNLLQKPPSTIPATAVLLDLNLSFFGIELKILSNETLHLHLQVLLHRYKNFIPPNAKKEMEFLSRSKSYAMFPLITATKQPTWHTSFWSDINNYLTKELPTFNQIFTTATPTSTLLNSVPTSLLFTRVCHDLKLDIVEMNQVVGHILSPDTIPLPEMDIGAFIRDRDPLGLAKRLRKDLLVVPGCEVEHHLGRDLELIFDVLGRSGFLCIPRNLDGASVGTMDYRFSERAEAVGRSCVADGGVDEAEEGDGEEGGEEDLEEKGDTDDDDDADEDIESEAVDDCEESEESEESEEDDEEEEEEEDNNSDSVTLANRDDVECYDGEVVSASEESDSLTTEEKTWFRKMNLSWDLRQQQRHK
ncbi:hypothetical protein BDV27DRAFT_149389 [Aspergillus caelatus]|uniref:Uncharacterized protein n=1 Tax=Aspergillus caelatus TaxID=61420 RepID=A0A5N6ZQL6_9EURO|nr:uncharacterized protein BDV27DRAFT_149389 [Aspergillus caelatus]KAE8359668.1 hypothetical protein BDV27DRAFT_149389 [Aspergillus caelatus]